MNRQDDAALAGGLVLIRRIPPKGDRVTWGEDGLPIPASQNFSDKQNELSVFIFNEAVLDDVLKGLGGFGIVQFTAQQVRDTYAAFARPVLICRDEEDSANGHVLICGKASPGIKERLRSHAKWVEGRWPAKPSP